MSSVIPEYLVYETTFKLGHEQIFSVWLKKPRNPSTFGSQLSVFVQVHYGWSERWLQEFFSNFQVLLCSLISFILKSDAIINFAVNSSLGATVIAV